MVIRRIEERPELANRIFQDVGKKELRFIINFGFFFGAALGFPMVFITEALPVLVGAADRRRGDRLRHQLGRAVDDLRAGRAAQDRAAEGPRPVHPPPARGRRRLRRDHRRRHRHAREHGRRAAHRPAVRSHPVDDREPPAARRSTAASAPARPGGPGRGGHAPVRRDPRVARHRGGRVHDDAARRPRVQPPAERRDPQADRRADARAAPGGLLRAAALGDARGRVAAAPARRRARLRRRPPAPGHLRARADRGAYATRPATVGGCAGCSSSSPR